MTTLGDHFTVGKDEEGCDNSLNVQSNYSSGETMGNDWKISPMMAGRGAAIHEDIRNEKKEEIHLKNKNGPSSRPHKFIFQHQLNSYKQNVKYICFLVCL